MFFLWDGDLEGVRRLASSDRMVARGRRTTFWLYLGPPRPPIRGEVMSPTFDFECLGCGIVEVYVRPFDDSNVPTCLECGQPTKRLFPVPTVVYKGDGWAKKDREVKSNG